MSSAVVFIISLIAILSFVHCLQNLCYKDFDMKHIGWDIYCYKIYSFDRFDIDEYRAFWNGIDGDQRFCEIFTQRTGQKGYSVSIRNRKEYEFVKVQYRTADFNLISVPLLIGLKYENGRFYWFDNSTFNYTDFFEPDYKTRSYLFRKGQCRRFYMYSPPTYGKRKYFVLDIDCRVRFYEYRLLCRYKVPRSDVIFASLSTFC
ncbi:unnamed protein product [Cercopithifilaria johnstoni]|uniref:Uncharacterized protein n=1 Tax=Cercopithifilaria johnstoni TaxID=2874296 RepID=A0A8J2PWI8_9BILA|nr:unnamed protein product [Cercopithifilaria johnstoni]